jgi:diphthamide biosynthesis protein 2
VVDVSVGRRRGVVYMSYVKVWRYSPVNSELRRETLSVNKTLMRRYFLVEKTKDADIIGIVAGTLGVCTRLLSAARSCKCLPSLAHWNTW